jgi:hypothetical protein
MTNTIALVLGGLIVLGLIFDQIWFGGAGTLFLAREFAQMIEWMAFWR